MVTFFSILFVLISINAILFVFSVNRNNQKTGKSSQNNVAQSASQVFPIDLSPANYKKAI
ncbi:MAG: hypothetical protein V3U92_18580 [Cellulophaga sp.]